MGGTCSTDGKKEKSVQSFSRRARKEIDHFEDTGLDFEAKINMDFREL
jgi:hypothetical protein